MPFELEPSSQNNIHWESKIHNLKLSLQKLGLQIAQYKLNPHTSLEDLGLQIAQFKSKPYHLPRISQANDKMNLLSNKFSISQ